MVVATHGNGIYQTNLTHISDILSVESPTKDLFEFKLFPNPTLDILSISLRMDDIGNASVLIYDEAGRKVGDNYNQILSTGLHTIKLNVADLKAGIYFVNLNVKGKTITKQIMKK